MEQYDRKGVQNILDTYQVQLMKRRKTASPVVVAY